MREYVVCDIETNVIGHTPDPSVDELRYVGFRNHEGKKLVYHYSEWDKIQNVLNNKTYIIGHNFREYDRPVMERHGFVFRDNIIIDTLHITNTRCKSMMYIDIPQNKRNLSDVADIFQLPNQKGVFNYKLLKANKLVGNDYELLVKYLHADLDTTWDLFMYYYNFFEGLRQYMSDYDNYKHHWLLSSPGATAYKAICYMADIPEEYEDVPEDSKRYIGGYVVLPTREFAHGNIYCIDFNSLYPHMMMQGNLYSPGKGWRGSIIYPPIYGNEVDGIRGEYKRDPGKVEMVIKRLYNDRLAVNNQLKKATDPQQKATLKRKKLAIKIIINTMYGLLGSPKFKSVASLTGATDCTAMARRSIKHARTVLLENGYECLYTDTDSVYVFDPFKDYDRLQKITEYISEEQRRYSNIPSPTHLFEIEESIRSIYFFKGDDGNFIKKCYIYVTPDDKVKVKGLKVIKGDCSSIARIIFDEKIKPLFVNKKYVPFKCSELANLVRRYASKHTDLLAKRFRTKPLEAYASLTSIQAQVSERYGAGEHYLVANTMIGAGKGKKYASMEELRHQYGDQWVSVIDIEPIMNDLKQFLFVDERKNIKKESIKNVEYKQLTMFEDK